MTNGWIYEINADAVEFIHNDAGWRCIPPQRFGSTEKAEEFAQWTMAILKKTGKFPNFCALPLAPESLPETV